jgi:hypothetical protein
MQTRSIDVKRANPGTDLATALMLAVTFAGFAGAPSPGNATQVPQVATLLATVRQIDPIYADLNQGGPNRGKVTLFPEDGTPYPEVGTLQSTDITVDQGTGSVLVRATFPDPEPWENFGRSVSGGAMPNCFGPDAVSHEGFAVQGLLRLPFLVHAAAAGACR